jgi:hypothetical protein
MTDEKKKYDEQLSAIMNRLADSVLDLSDEQILAEAREEGIDPLNEAERIRDMLRDSSKTYRMQKLIEAERIYKNQVAKLRDTRLDLPQSPADRRNLLAAVFAAKPDIQSLMLTARHRNFEELTDSDVESSLKQLAYLGVLASFNSKDK